MRSVIAVRRENQPSLPSLGSVYKRVGNTAAAIFIEGAGLKGYRVNDMEVSAVHANFIVNKGNGKADDYLTIMEHIEEKVYARYGIKLEREVFVVGKRA
jgi:UDP-N-acetylmuramate dehydrogenase